MNLMKIRLVFIINLTSIKNSFPMKQIHEFYDELENLQEDSTQRIKILEKLIETIENNGKNNIILRILTKKKGNFKDELNTVENNFSFENENKEQEEME